MKKAALLWPAIMAQIDAFLSSSSSWKMEMATGNKLNHVQSTSLMTPAVDGTPSTMVYSASKEEQEDLTSETIAEMIEVSFLQSCLQLSQGYVDVLKLFIVAVKTGYQKKIPLDELHELVKNCPVNSAGRDLMKEEVDLRREWMAVVYEMMKALNHENNNCMSVTLQGQEPANPNYDSQKRVAQVVDSMLQLQQNLQEEEHKSGGEQDSVVALTNLTVEKALQKLPSLSQLHESIQSPMKKAFLTNDIRVALLTFKVIEEEKVCLEDSKGKKIPRPPIKYT
jgi:hypothetical protein